MEWLKSLLVIKGAWGQAKSFTRQTHGADVERRVPAMLLTSAATRAVAVASNVLTPAGVIRRPSRCSYQCR
ncbi:hypothetical protein [Pyrobaculum islandicum]|uniref:hypothetical protein n=1 Tax=Pyrobaculum islandicum TaxID=2277 RepID=UPI00143328EF|nr:hypothetical protein [Pyrobaculum islandicum]